MLTDVQPSLLDLVRADPESGPALGELRGRTGRTTLCRGAWVDARPAWVGGSDEVFQALASQVAWRAEERPMYDRVVAVPRLLAWFGEHETWPHPILATARDALDEYYAAPPGHGFASAGLCLYRDGRDSVAWHGDTIGRGRDTDVMVAIVSFGAPRALLLRPRGGGEVVRHTLGHGDLLVMGGSCQRTWEHAVPKTARPVGPRISVQFRPHGVA